MPNRIIYNNNPENVKTQIYGSDPNQPILYKTSKAAKFDAEDLSTSTANMQQNKSCDENGDTEQWYIAKNI